MGTTFFQLITFHTHGGGNMTKVVDPSKFILIFIILLILSKGGSLMCDYGFFPKTAKIIIAFLEDADDDDRVMLRLL